MNVFNWRMKYGIKSQDLSSYNNDKTLCHMMSIMRITWCHLAWLKTKVLNVIYCEIPFDNIFQYTFWSPILPLNRIRTVWSVLLTNAFCVLKISYRLGLILNRRGIFNIVLFFVCIQTSLPSNSKKWKIWSLDIFVVHFILTLASLWPFLCISKPAYPPIVRDGKFNV